MLAPKSSLRLATSLQLPVKSFARFSTPHVRHFAAASVSSYSKPSECTTAFCHSSATRPTTCCSSGRRLKPSPQHLRRFSQANSLAASQNKMSNNADFTLSEVFNLKGKVALVTGGGSGIGLMATQALAVNGAKVYIVGRTKEKLDQVVKVHGQDIAGEIIPLVGDVTNKEGVEQLVKEIESREKCLCILVNNAGIAPEKTTPDGEDAEDLKKNLFGPTTLDEWTSVYATNVVGPYFMSTAFLPLLQKATEHQYGYSGTIINITSISGLVKISQGHFSYNASKGAMVHLNKLLASEIAKVGLKIRVNAIAPGVFPSEMTTQESKENQKSEMPKEKKEGLPASRPGNDRDMASAIIFAATNQYLNGQNIVVDGGYLIQVGQ